MSKPIFMGKGGDIWEYGNVRVDLSDHLLRLGFSTTTIYLNMFSHNYLPN
jgi:hypothetical protein